MGFIILETILSILPFLVGFFTGDGKKVFLSLVATYFIALFIWFSTAGTDEQAFALFTIIGLFPLLIIPSIIGNIGCAIRKSINKQKK